MRRREGSILLRYRILWFMRRLLRLPGELEERAFREHCIYVPLTRALAEQLERGPSPPRRLSLQLKCDFRGHELVRELVFTEVGEVE